MYIQFVGTGSGKTSLKRFHSSFIISNNKFNLLVDCGDAVSFALLSQNIQFDLIDGILFSHFHSDHYTGLPSFLTQSKMIKRENPLQLFTEINNINFLQEFIFNSYLFKERMGFHLIFNSFDNNNKFFVDENFSVISKQNSHLNKYKKYDSENKLSFSSSSFLFELNDKKIIYTGDIGDESDLFIFRNENPDFFISELTHISVEEIINNFEKLNSKKILLTHISEENEVFAENPEKFLPNKLKSKVTPVFDGNIFTI